MTISLLPKELIDREHQGETFQNISPEMSEHKEELGSLEHINTSGTILELSELSRS